MNEVQGTLEVAKGISDLGVLIIIGAAFIVLSLGMWVALFRWFKSIMDNVIKNNSATMSALLTKTDAQNDVLNEIADGLRPSTLLQIKNISNTCFDLSTEKVCRIIKKVREENHIADKEATKAKNQDIALQSSRGQEQPFRQHQVSGQHTDPLHFPGMD